MVTMRRRATLALVLTFAVVTVAVGSGIALAAPAEAPFGDKVSAAIARYNRASPYIATSAKYDAAAVAEVKELGFKTAVELRTPNELGEGKAGAALRAAGLKYVNIPVASMAPNDAQVAAFAKIADDPANYPILLNCHSANRSGAMWALYRAAKGVPAMVAVEEGRTAGLKPNREAAVRKRLGLPPLVQN